MIEVWCVCEGTGVMPVLGIHIICPKCKGVGLLQIKGENMSEDGLGDRIQENKQTVAHEEYAKLEKQYEDIKDKVWYLRSETIKIKDSVRSFFQERYNEEDYPDELTITIDDINDLLTSISASELAKAFTATANVEISFTVLAETREDAESIVNDYIDGIDIFTSEGDEHSVDNYDVHIDY
jgi:predicted nuclease with TOPRIM domain